MSEKTYIFEGGNNEAAGLLNSIIPALQNKGVDTAALLAAMGNNNGGLFGGRGFEDIIALIIVAAIFGNGNGFGFGNGGNNNSTERELLANMIQRNGTDLSQLAQTIGCSNGRIQDAITAVSTQLCNFAGQNGLSFQQVVNSIQAGNATLASQMASCCCDQKLAICNQTNTLSNAINGVAVGQERGFSNLAYASAQQTCDITKAIADNTAQVLAGQRAAELREVNRELAAKDAKIAEQAVIINNAQQSAMFGQMIAQATAPLGTALNALQSDVNGIKCKLPETQTIAKNNGVYLDACCAGQLGIGPLATLGLLNNGFYNNGVGFFG